MAEALADISAGIPVEIGKIDRELKKLWETTGGTTTRASLVNFAVYCEGTDRMAANTEIIAEFTRDHACRAILIAVEPHSPVRRAQAWISAHCHVSRAGAKQVCCEQITFLLEGASADLIPNIVFSHLDSDLPLYLWWRAEFPDPIDAQLWTWVDRLIFDSQKWDEPLKEFRRLRASFAKVKPRMTIRDLNWTRSLHIREAVAQLFDYSENAIYLSQVSSASITHGPGYRSTAVLLAGWFMAQLGWTIERHQGSAVTFRAAGSDQRIAFEFREEMGASIGGLAMDGGGASFRITNEASSDFQHADVLLPDGREYHHLLPSTADDTLALLNREMMRGVGHGVYLRALSAVEPLLEH